MYWLKRVSFAAALVIATIAALFTATPQAAEASIYEGTIAITCTDMDATDTGAHILNRDNTGTGDEHIRVLATDGSGKVILDYDYFAPLGTYAGGIGDWAWTAAPEYNPITVQIISMAGNGLPMQVDYTETGTCEGLPTYEPDTAARTTPEPGCRTEIAIPDQAVGGEMIAPAMLYAEPGVQITPTTVVEAGNTARVLGIDSSGQYYKIIWNCQKLWVPRATMGPNHDSVWQGMPLPTTVVS